MTILASIRAECPGAGLDLNQHSPVLGRGVVIYDAAAPLWRLRAGKAGFLRAGLT